MSFSFLGPDPLESQINGVLHRLAEGDPPNQIEIAQVDVKEEVSRRRPGGLVLSGASQND